MDDTAKRINEKVCKTAEEFNGLLDEFVKDLVPREVRNTQRRVALDVLNRIVMKTPVRTGRARSNWQTSIGSAPESVVWLEDPVKTGEIVLGSLPVYSIVFLTNNVPYIIYLEDGTSKQAPNGMVALSFEEMKAQFV